MALNSLNKINFHFVCTNYGSSKDGIGHYTSKIVDELKKDNLYQITVYSRKTHHFKKLKLFYSLRMTKEIIKLIKKMYNNSEKNFIILEYPFVEYNPILFLFLSILKLTLKKNSKFVLSLHEYNRTKRLRKFFIKSVILLSDIVLYTKEIDIFSFGKRKTHFKERSIPANIQPLKEYQKEIKDEKIINLCFFGIINFASKEIENMMKAWEVYSNEKIKNKIHFYFITSSNNVSIQENKSIQYHYNLKDEDVSKLLAKMQFIILPIKPKVSINNGSLSVGCVHKCIPVGVFDLEYFDDDFGISMNNYCIKEFVRIYKLINKLDFNKLQKKENQAFKYGAKKSIINTISSYTDII